MAELISIPGIEESSLELLEAAGFHSAEDLAKAGLDDLTRELERANSVLKITNRPPEKADIGKWIAAARKLAGVSEEPASPIAPASPDERPAVNYEHTPQVAAMLAVAPFAIPLPARVLVENQLGVSDIPAAILLNRYAGDLDVKAVERLPKISQPKATPASSGNVQIADTGNARLEIDTSRLRSTEDRGILPQRVSAIKTEPGNDRIALLRAPRPSTNKGRSPSSRWYIRGVLHSHPVSIYIGAFVTLVTMVTVPAAVISAALLFISGEFPQQFSWVPKWLLVIPAALPVVGIAYLFWGLGGSCRICGQKLFAHRAHLKNKKAHHVRGLGYIVPLCFQILIFRWFRCTHCGTPVRLKE